MTRKASKADAAQYLAEMRETIPAGTTLTTVLRHRSPSGMTRAIDVYQFSCEDGRVSKSWLSYRVAAVIGEPFSERYEAVNVYGAGMDMGFHLVYGLARRLFPDGFDCTGERCPSNDHTNGMPRPAASATALGYYPEIDRPHHSDGGYALRQEWLG